MSNRLRDEQLIFLQRLKTIFSSTQHIQSIKTTKPEIKNSDHEKNFIEVNELLERIERIEKALELQTEEGIRKAKVKEQIISLLQQHKKLTASQLSKLIGLSRTRCSEYFRELTREGRTEGVIINRQKYYKVVEK